MQVQARVAHRAIEALILAILPGLARFDVQRLHITLCQPGLHCRRYKLCAIVAAQVHRRAVLGQERREHIDHAIRRRCQRHIQRQSLARERIDDGQDPQRRTICQGILHKITGPDMTRIGCLQACWTRSSHAFPQHAAHLEPMASPQSTHALLIDRLRPIDQDIDPTISIARVTGRQILNLGQQRRVVGGMRGI